MLRYIDVKLKQSSSESKSLNQVYNHDEDMPEFAILGSKGEQIGPWMKCKDYIQDTIWAGKAKKSCSVYGFSYKHGVDPEPCLSRLMLALRWPSKSLPQMARMLINTKRVVEDLETRLKVPKFERTRFTRVKDSHFIVSGSPVWLKSSHTVSFFSFLIRGSLLNETGRLETSRDSSPVKKDVYYLLTGKKFIKNLLENGVDSLESNWNVESANNLHNHGFVHYSTNKLSAKTPTKQISNMTDEDWEF